MFLSKPKLRSMMRRAGIRSFGELAKKAGIHRNSITDTIQPFSSTYLSLCNALNTHPLKLISDEASEIQEICNEVAPRYGFFLYGSRAKGTEREFSDYDLGMTGGENHLVWDEFLSIKNEIDERCDDLPIKVSLLNFDDAPTSFLDDFDSPIEFFAGNKEAFTFFKGVLSGRKKVA